MTVSTALYGMFQGAGQMQLTSSTLWVLASLITSLAFVAVTFFLSGDVRTFGYIAVAFGFAAFSAIMSNNSEKRKNQ